MFRKFLNGSAVPMSGKSLTFQKTSPKPGGSASLSAFMFYISKNNPCYYFTSVTNHRLPVFRTDKIKEIVCQAINEARNSSEILIFAYVIMPDHFHLITNSKLKPSNILRYLNGVTARRVIDYLKENNFIFPLDKLKQFEKKRCYKYSLWEHHSDTFTITSESMFMQKVNYIHLNPVRAELVKTMDDYLYSSVRIWKRKPFETEPLEINTQEIKWREA
jgi:putative transposase